MFRGRNNRVYRRFVGDAGRIGTVRFRSGVVGIVAGKKKNGGCGAKDAAKKLKRVHCFDFRMKKGGRE